MRPSSTQKPKPRGRAIPLFRFAIGLAAALLLVATPALGCFGARLRIGVPGEPASALASYAAGYFIEEKTGIEPEFVEVGVEPHSAFDAGRFDLFLAPGSVPSPEGATLRPAGTIPGVGPARFWIHPEVLDDLRFYTVNRTLDLAPAFFASGSYREAAEEAEPGKRAARRAVLNAD